MKLPRQLLTVVQELGELRTETVFVGGIIRPLLVTDPAVIGARPTDDVDLIVDVNRAGYIDLSARLRSHGFREDDSAGAPICRWRVKGVPVDVMPIDPVVLGFSNVWYLSGLRNATRLVVDGEPLLTLSSVYFCATKLEAFASRGERDGQKDFFHHDLEDVITIVDGCPTFVADVDSAASDVRLYISSEVASLVSHRRFLDALPGHLAPDEASQARARLILSRLQALANLVPLEKHEAPAHPAVTTHDVAAAEATQGTLRAPFGLPSASGWVRVRSSNLRAVSYDPITSTLSIEFHGRRIYEYDGVPPTLFTGLLGAPSVGRYHNLWIKNRYDYRRIQ